MSLINKEHEAVIELMARIMPQENKLSVADELDKLADLTEEERTEYFVKDAGESLINAKMFSVIGELDSGDLFRKIANKLRLAYAERNGNR